MNHDCGFFYFKDFYKKKSYVIFWLLDLVQIFGQWLTGLVIPRACCTWLDIERFKNFSFLLVLVYNANIMDHETWYTRFIGLSFFTKTYQCWKLIYLIGNNSILFFYDLSISCKIIFINHKIESVFGLMI